MREEGLPRDALLQLELAPPLLKSTGRRRCEIERFIVQIQLRRPLDLHLPQHLLIRRFARIWGLRCASEKTFIGLILWRKRLALSFAGSWRPLKKGCEP